MRNTDEIFMKHSIIYIYTYLHLHWFEVKSQANPLLCVELNRKKNLRINMSNTLKKKQSGRVINNFQLFFSHFSFLFVFFVLPIQKSCSHIHSQKHQSQHMLVDNMSVNVFCWYLSSLLFTFILISVVSNK